MAKDCLPSAVCRALGDREGTRPRGPGVGLGVRGQYRGEAPRAGDGAGGGGQRREDGAAWR